MSEMTMPNQMIGAPAGGARRVASPVQADAAGCAFASDPQAKRRALLLLAHADFALFQPGGVCEKAKSVRA